MSEISLDMDKLRETFFMESEEHMSSMETCILEMERDPEDRENLDALFRAAHSLKGNSGCLGFDEVNKFTHALETVLDRLRGGSIEKTGETISVLLESVDCVRALVFAAKSGNTAGQGVEETHKKLKGLIDGDGPAPGSLPSSPCDANTTVEGALRPLRIVFRPGPDTLRRGIDPLNHIVRQLSDCGEVIRTITDTSMLPKLSEIDPEISYLSWEIVLLTDKPAQEIEWLFQFVRDESRLEITDLAGARSTENLPLKEPPRKMIGEILVEEKIITRTQLEEALKKQKKTVREEPASMRVDTEKVDKLVNLVGELVIMQSAIAKLTENPSKDGLPQMRTAASLLERKTREIQEKVMSIRMMPVGSIFSRLARIVRDVSQAAGKKAVLEVSGEETELDKSVIEKISDPLTHLIRNAVDHGIERPEERVLKGKPEEGAVRLRAYHGGGSVLVTVEDDGRGLDSGKIIAKAVEKGLVDPRDADSLTEHQAHELLFRPGFSTAEAVTDISGRGVGMDVVRRNIEDLGGSVKLESARDAGTRVVLRLPLTLAIIDGLTVCVGSETFIIPINTILESLRPKRPDVRTIKGEWESVNIRGDHIPLVRLHRLFNVTPLKNDPWDSLVVVVAAGGERYALMVDDLTGEQQVVIKSMGDGLRNIPGIAGATILGDGRVSLILDIEGTVRKYFSA